MKKNTVKKQMTDGSPTKIARQPTVQAKSPTKTRKGKAAAKTEGAHKEKKESTLASPTSNSMQNSFIIKNADESFDAYYQVMKKRRLGQGAPGLDNTMTGASPSPQSSNFGVVSGIQPAARDGHTADISAEGLMFVFGGDRHLMPFNDLYLMSLKG